VGPHAVILEQHVTPVRRPDWASRLHTYLVTHSQDKFGYGQLDCCLFAADCIREMTGMDLAAPFRGQYRSRKAALQAIRAYAGSSSVQAIAEKVFSEHGLEKIPVLEAGRGDIVLLERSIDYSLGLIDFNGRDVLVISRRGLWRLPLSQLRLQAVCAWRV